MVQLIVRIKLFLIIVELLTLLLVVLWWYVSCGGASLLVVEVHVVHVLLGHWQRVLLVKLLHDLHVDLIVHLKPLRFDLLLPDIVMNLHVVQNGVDQRPNVRVFIRKQLKNNRHHLGLMKDDFASGAKKQELKEGVQDLLDHFIIFLLGAEQVLQELNQVRRCNRLCDLIIAANRADQHDALEQDVILCVAVHQVVVQELNQVPLLNFFGP